MSEAAPVPTTEKRKRFQFSLRTLLIVILAYTIAWGLTASWGISDCYSRVEQNLRENVKDGAPVAPVIRSEGHLIINYEGLAAVHVRVSAPMPFLLIFCENQQLGSSATEVPRTRTTMIWFCGFMIPIYESYYRSKK